MLTYARVYHHVEVISQFLDAIEELRTGSLECRNGLKFFLLLDQPGSCCRARYRAQQLRLTIGCY